MGGRRFNGRFLPVLVDTRLGQLGRPKLEADWEYQTLIGTIKWISGALPLPVDNRTMSTKILDIRNQLLDTMPTQPTGDSLEWASVQWRSLLPTTSSGFREIGALRTPLAVVARAFGFVMQSHYLDNILGQMVRWGWVGLV